MKESKLFTTDYYQLAMNYVYILEEKANEEVVFEAFVRKIKTSVNKEACYYIFSGKVEVERYLEEVRRELREDREALLDLFREIIYPKVDKNIRKRFDMSLERLWYELDIDFDYSIAEEGSILKPIQPAFQYRGPRWIGQLIETRVLNLINGRSGMETFMASATDKQLIQKLTILTTDIVDDNKFYREYREEVRAKAREYREATSKSLMEAGFRRAPSMGASTLAANIALDEGFDGTSNLAAYFDGLDLKYIGGSCSHSFIMSFETEVEAYKTWLKYYPQGTLLIDTYDVMEAARIIVENNLDTSCVRIDSEPLDGYAQELRAYFDANGRKDIKIFISGDLTPEKLKDFEEREIPFDLAMAGTKLVNLGDLNKINCGFVYKLVVNSIGRRKTYPEKKAKGKGSYGGYKMVYVENGNIIVEKTENNIGIIDSMNFEKNAAVILRGF